MSFAEDPGRATAWEDYEHEQIYLTYQVSGQSDNGNSEGLWHDWEPLDGSLGRGEVAELVAVIPNAYNPTLEGNSGSNKGRLRDSFSFQINTDQWLPESKETADVAQEGRVPAGSGTLNGEFVQDIMSSVFYHATLANHTGNDATAGASTTQSVFFPPEMHYRDMYGRGPLFDHNDVIKAWKDLHWDNNTTSNIEIFSEWEFVWDIFEVEDPLDDVPR